jgi:hypothetical protein
VATEPTTGKEPRCTHCLVRNNLPDYPSNLDLAQRQTSNGLILMEPEDLAYRFQTQAEVVDYDNDGTVVEGRIALHL